MSKKNKGLFRRLVDGLAKTRRGLIESLREAITGHTTLDDELVDDLESILLSSDVGVKTTEHIIDRLKDEMKGRKIEDTQFVLDLIKSIILDIVGEDEFELALDEETPTPFVILVAGVNGTGKTTTIGKLAGEFCDDGFKTLLVAADTFRAAAADQLGIWSERTGADLVRREEGADPASVTFDGINEAISGKYDVVLIDTAGRLHTKKHLMAELEKINRVIKKVLPDAPHETLLVLDATTGQNAIQQCTTFNEILEITAIAMTKLDGTAKGGILVAISHLFDIPIVKIGIGEGQEDLRDFLPADFVWALFGETPEYIDEEEDAEVAS
jgi:fused signal recognition particle receptor